MAEVNFIIGVRTSYRWVNSIIQIRPFSCCFQASKSSELLCQPFEWLNKQTHCYSTFSKTPQKLVMRCLDVESKCCVWFRLMELSSKSLFMGWFSSCPSKLAFMLSILIVHRWLSSPWAFFGWKSAFFRCPQRRRCCRRRRRHHRRRYRRCCCCVLNRARRFKVHLALIKSALHFSLLSKEKSFPRKKEKKRKFLF